MPAKLKTLTASILLAIPLAATALERTELLPAAAQSYIRISGTTNFWSSLQQTSIGKLWMDRQFQDFLGNPAGENLGELLFDGEPDAEEQVFLQQIKMLTGEVVLGIDLESEEPCLIAAMSAEDFQRSLEMDAKLAGSMEDPFKIIKDSFQGVEIVQHIDGTGTPDESSYWHTQVNGTFILGYSREWVEKCIVRIKAEKAEEPTGNPTLNINIPVSDIIRLIIEEEKASNGGVPQPMDTELLLEALGLMGVQHFRVAVELKPDEMVIDSNLRIDDLNKGLFTIFDVRPTKLPTLSFIPENIAMLEVGRFNLLRFWQEIPVIINTVMPEAKPQFDMLVAMLQQQAGINLEQDLLNHLGTRYVSFSVAEPDLQSSVIAVALKDADAFRTGLETVIAAPALQPQISVALVIDDFLDHTIYTLADSEPGEAIAFSVASDHLLYGEPDGLRQVIRSGRTEGAGNNGFEQSALVKGLREHVPAGAFGYSAVDWKKNMDTIVRELGKPEYAAVMQQSWIEMSIPLPPPDLSKLPPADHIASFFNVSYQYAEANGSGLHQRIILKY